MPETLIAFLIVLLALAVGGVVFRWAVKLERKAQARETMGRVYYLRRGVRDAVPEWKRIDAE